MTRPETSIVIRTFNEERDLPRLLEAIHEQRYQDFEVIDVDSGSYDRTTAIAQEHGARLLRISSRDFTFGYSLNVGVEAALGKIVVLVSAHTEPHDVFWLERLIEPLRTEGLAMVYGRQFGTPKSKFGELRDLERTFGPERKVMAPPKFSRTMPTRPYRGNCGRVTTLTRFSPGKKISSGPSTGWSEGTR